MAPIDTENRITQPLVIDIEEDRAIATLSRPLVLLGTYTISFKHYEPKAQMSIAIVGEYGHVVATSEETDEGLTISLNTKALATQFKGHIDTHRPAAINTKLYVLDGAQTIAIGQVVILRTKIAPTDEGSLVDIDMRGPVGPRGPQGIQGKDGIPGPKGDNGKDGFLLGGLSFSVEEDGHLWAYANDIRTLYHDGDKSKPRFKLGDGSKEMPLAGHLYQISYDPIEASHELGSVIGPQGQKGDSGDITADDVYRIIGIDRDEDAGYGMYRHEGGVIELFQFYHNLIWDSRLEISRLSAALTVLQSKFAQFVDSVGRTYLTRSFAYPKIMGLTEDVEELKEKVEELEIEVTKRG